MFGAGAIIKAVAYLLIVTMLLGGAYYVTGLRAELAVSQENERKLQDGIVKQQETIAQMQADIAAIQEANKKLDEQNRQLQKDSDALASKFDKRDFGALAASKPKVIEKLVNRGTVNAMRCLELASGAPLTEDEKNAKSPTQANRECPALIDSDYTAPAN